MVLTTYEEVMAIEVGKYYHVVNPLNGTLVRCKFTCDCQPYIRPVQGKSTGLTAPDLETLARRIANKMYKISMGRR